jgi:serine/threonine-protein kinase
VDSYRFEYRQRKLRTLALVNSKGNIVNEFGIEQFDRPVNAVFSYRANGNIDYVLHLDRNDKVLFKKSYDEGKDGKINMFIFRYNDEYGTEKQLPKDMTGYVRLENEFAERGNVSRFALTFDERGFVSAVHYRNVNQPVGDGEHIYGKRYDRDEKGRVIKEYFLNHDDSVRAASWGLGITQFEYNAEDNLVKAVYLAPDGSPAYNRKDGFSVHAMEYDKYGNMTFSWYQTSDGTLTISKVYDIAGYKNEYNESGQLIKFVFLGTDKNPMYSTNAGYIGTQPAYDDNGWVNKITYIDESGQPTVTSIGTAVVVRKTDPKGNILEFRTFDIDNQPIESAGFFKTVMEYDQTGNMLSRYYYDANDSLCLTINGIAGESWEYNDQNKLVKTVSYGTDKQPCENKSGVIICKYDYDVRGDEIKRTFYEGGEKTLKLSNQGIAGWNSEYENHKETKREFFDENGQPTSGYLNFAKWEAAYDDMGNQTEISYFDENGNFVEGRRRVYDERGNLVEGYRMGEDKKVARGYLIGRYKYDERGNQIEYALYDNNELAMNTAGYAKINYTYDDRNQETERRYYGANGNLVVNKSEGHAIRKLEYNNRGNNTKTSFFDTSEKPMEGNNGYATAISEFNAMGRIVRETYFDEAGKPTKPEKRSPELIRNHDKWGNANYVAFADGSGNIVVLPHLGFAINRYEFDIRHNKISESFYDADDKPCIDTIDGVHRIDYAYDKQNRQTEISYYDTNNKPCLNEPDGIHKKETTYDAWGSVTEERYYDASVSLRKDGYAIEKTKYDELGRLIEHALYDYLDRPVNGKQRWHRYVRSYEETGVMYDIHYSVNNTIVQEWKYDPGTNEWARIDSWRQYFQDAKPPFNINDYTRVTAITISGNVCSITIRLNFSKYDLSGADMIALEDEAKNYAKTWRENSEMPRYASLVLYGIDNAGRDLYRIYY